MMDFGDCKDLYMRYRDELLSYKSDRKLLPPRSGNKIDEVTMGGFRAFDTLVCALECAGKAVDALKNMEGLEERVSLLNLRLPKSQQISESLVTFVQRPSKDDDVTLADTYLNDLGEILFGADYENERVDDIWLNQVVRAGLILDMYVKLMSPMPDQERERATTDVQIPVYELTRVKKKGPGYVSYESGSEALQGAFDGVVDGVDVGDEDDFADNEMRRTQQLYAINFSPDKPDGEGSES